MLNNPQEALVQFIQELELRPEQPDALDGLGWTYLKLDRLAEARATFDRAIRYQPLNNQSIKGLMQVKKELARQRLKPKTSAPLKAITKAAKHF